MRPEDVIGAVLRGVLLSRPKSSARTLRRLGRGDLLSASNVLTAAAAAWGLYEAWQQGEAPSAGPPVPTRAPAPTPAPPPTPRVGSGEAASNPPPLPAPPPASEEDGFAPAVVRLVRLLIAAARADGDLKPEEGALIARHAAAAEAEALVRAELHRYPNLAEVVGTVKEPAAAAELYSLAFAVLRADEDVSGDERRWLGELERLLGIDPPSARRLEEAVAAGIDAAEPR
ncbi:MAG TPA: DUF533 domain-containing protein [Vicinamibacteria bacterium]|nr:DUF533 domain-containing protein [Vicinamibacteria bacterium]